MKHNLTAIILAAGYSSRMGRFKPLLPLGDATVIERVVALYRAAGIEDIRVVVGHNADVLSPELASLGVRTVYNPEYHTGMFSSLVAGLKTLTGDCHGFFVHPVDIPLVRPATVAALARAFAAQPSAVHHPEFDGRRGHPPLIPADFAQAILSWSGEGGLKTFWEDHSPAMRDVPVADESILWDMDTEADYQCLADKSAAAHVLSIDECRVLMTRVVAVPDTVWRHCQAVAQVAMALTAAVNRCGAGIDADLVHAAALVHDVAKTLKRHAVVGAGLLEDLGFPDMAAVVRVHIDIDTDPEQALDEAQIVYLADKLIRGDRLASLDERMARKMAKHGADKAARAAITRRIQTARWIMEKVERLAGRKVEEIVAQQF